MAATTWGDKNRIYPKKFDTKYEYQKRYDDTLEYYKNNYDSLKYPRTYRDYDKDMVKSTLSKDIDNYRDVYTLMLRASVSIPRNQITPKVVLEAIKQLQKQVEDHIRKELNNALVYEEPYGKGIPTLLEESIKDLVVEPVDTKQLDYERYIKENKNAVTS